MIGIDPLAALAIHVGLSAAVVALVIGVSAVLREKRSPRIRDAVYESGVLPAASQGPLNAPYFLIAALFVIFDMEAGILFPWSVAVRQAGWTGLIEAAVFILLLLAALAYLWIDGALDWGPRPRS